MRVLLSPAAEPHPLWKGHGQNSSRHQWLPRSWSLFQQLLARLSLVGGWPGLQRPSAVGGFVGGFKKEESAQAWPSLTEAFLRCPLESHWVATLQLLQDLISSMSIPQHLLYQPWCDRHTAIDKYCRPLKMWLAQGTKAVWLSWGGSQGSMTDRPLAWRCHCWEDTWSKEGNAQPVFCLAPFSFVWPSFSLVSLMHYPHILLLQQGSSTLSTVNIRNVGNWDAKEFGFACPLKDRTVAGSNPCQSA